MKSHQQAVSHSGLTPTASTLAKNALEATVRKYPTGTKAWLRQVDKYGTVWQTSRQPHVSNRLSEYWEHNARNLKAFPNQLSKVKVQKLPYVCQSQLIDQYSKMQPTSQTFIHNTQSYPGYYYNDVLCWVNTAGLQTWIRRSCCEQIPCQLNSFNWFI